MNILNCENEYLIEALLLLQDDFIGKVLKAVNDLINKKEVFSCDEDVINTATVIYKSILQKENKKLEISKKRKDSNSKRKNIKRV